MKTKDHCAEVSWVLLDKPLRKEKKVFKEEHENALALF